MISGELKIIIRNNNDCDGITESIINKLKNEFSNVSGIVLDCNLEERERDKSFNYIPASVFCTLENDILSDAQIPIDGEILDAMLPYKSMAIHIMMRTLQYDVFDRKYCEDIYYKHLKYWYNIILSNNINYVLFMCIPHHVGEYILYSLCKIKRIKMTMMDPKLYYCGLGCILGNDIYNVGASIKDRYNNFQDEELKEDSFSDFMKGVVDNINSKSVMGVQNYKKITKETRKIMFSNISLIKILELRLRIIKHHFNDNKKLVYLNNELYYTKKARIYEKKMDHLKDYMKLSCFPEENVRYIYYPLQMTPEASTMPMAGEFKNQILSIELLAKAAKECNLYVYVKEHWVQYNREREFYKKISKIENVKLIDLSVNSLELIEKSVLVASQTGNCLLEALIKHKYALSIGKGNPYKGAPNVIPCENYNQIFEAINKIQNSSLEINDDEIKKYLIALDDSLVFSYLDSLDEAYYLYNKEETAEKIVSFSLLNYIS